MPEMVVFGTSSGRRGLCVSGERKSASLFEDVRVLFAPLAPAKRAGEGGLRLPEQHAQTTEKAHGRLDMRSIRVSSELKGYSDWPGLEQVFEIRRCWQSKGVWKESIRYGVTSLPATIAIPERVLKLKRGHWTIENGLHYVKDVTLGPLLSPSSNGERYLHSYELIVEVYHLYVKRMSHVS